MVVKGVTNTCVVNDVSGNFILMLISKISLLHKSHNHAWKICMRCHLQEYIKHRITVHYNDSKIKVNIP